MDSYIPQNPFRRIPNFFIIKRQFITEHYVSTLYIRGGGKDKKKKKKDSQAASDPRSNAQQFPSFQPPPNPSFQPPPFQPLPFQPPSNRPPSNRPLSSKHPPMLSQPIINTPSNQPQNPNPNPSKALLSVHSNLQNISFLPPGYPNPPSQNPSQPPAQPSQTPTTHPTHPGLLTRLKVAIKIRDKDTPSRPASWRCGAQKEHNGVYGYARAKRTNEKGKKVAIGPVGLAINRKKLTHEVVQEFGEELPGRAVEFEGMFRREVGKGFWYVPLAREEGEGSGDDSD